MRADMAKHTVTVHFDDEEVQLDAIVEALNEAGYTTGDPKKLD